MQNQKDIDEILQAKQLTPDNNSYPLKDSEECVHYVTAHYDQPSQSFITYCIKCGKILDIRLYKTWEHYNGPIYSNENGMDMRNDIIPNQGNVETSIQPKMLSETRITKVQKSTKKDKKDK